MLKSKILSAKFDPQQETIRNYSLFTQYKIKLTIKRCKLENYYLK